MFCWHFTLVKDSILLSIAVEGYCVAKKIENGIVNNISHQFLTLKRMNRVGRNSYELGFGSYEIGEVCG